jgi:hypothetical protein
MDPALKALIEAKTGIVIDGKLTTDEILAIYKFLKPTIDLLFPDLIDTEDAIIDKLEARIMTRTGFRKTLGLAFCKGVRQAINCPDDDDNVVQK